MRSYLILGIFLLILISPVVCKEVAYAFGDDNRHPIGESNLTDYRGNDIVSFTISATPGGPQVSQKAQRTEEFFKKEINEKINVGNQSVRDEGVRLVGRRSGAQSIDQISSIYDYLVGNWTYVSDSRGLEVFQYSNYTLEMGREVGSSGKGDCDDFAILLASLIDSIGGTPRIILANGPAGGHAYTEVYLGKMGGQDKNLDRILSWLRSEYRVNEIYYHTNPISGEIWLNLDWWKDTNGANHPGGPFYQAATQVPINLREDIPKTPLTPIENFPPIALFSYSPIQPVVGEPVHFNASQSGDPRTNGKIVYYEWSFGDGSFTQGNSKIAVTHIYEESGRFLANLTLTDNEGVEDSKTQVINVYKSPAEVVVTPIGSERRDNDSKMDNRISQTNINSVNSSNANITNSNQVIYGTQENEPNDKFDKQIKLALDRFNQTIDKTQPEQTTNDSNGSYSFSNRTSVKLKNGTADVMTTVSIKSG
jgi:PKD domain/Transglutaminase-like superfamily